MDGHHTDGSPDRELGQVLQRVLAVPPPQPDLLADLEPKLAEVDAEAPRPAAGGLASFVRRRRAALVAGAAAAAVLVAIGLFDLPGLGGPSPQRATAADRMVEAIDAGLAHVQTVQGLVTFPGSGPEVGNYGQIASVRFAATAAGDRWFDVTYRPDFAQKQKEWKQALAFARKQGSPAAVTASSPEFLEANSALVREVMVANGASGVQQEKRWAVNPFVRRTVGIRYHVYEGLFESDLLQRQAPQVWSLSTELRAALTTQEPRIGVTAVTAQGRPAWRVVIYGRGGRASYVAVIDRRYGLTLSLDALPGARGVDGLVLTPFHTGWLRVNQRVDPARFMMKADYSHAPSGFGPRRPGDAASHYVMDLGVRAFPLTELSRHESSYTLLPSWISPGYRLVLATRTPDDSIIWLTYRRGMGDLIVGTPGANAAGDFAPLAKGFVFSQNNDEMTWTILGPGVSRASHGAARGWPMAFVALPLARNAVASSTTAVSGSAPRALLQRMFGSLRPVRPGPHLPADRFGAAAWLLFVAAIALVFAGGTVLARRRRRIGRTALPRVARLSLVGAAGVLLGLALPWHQLYGSGGDFGVRGWNDPVGVLAAALALVAGFAAWATACAVTPPGRRWAISGRFLAILLGLATLASTALGFFYLPVKARFLVAYDVELRFTSLSSLGSYLRGSACPAPGPGLYLAIAGAVLLVVGALRLRADRAAIDAPD